MAEKHPTGILNSRKDQINEQFAKLDDRNLAIAIRDFTEEAIAENGVYYDSDDIAAAAKRLYPVIAHIVFNSDFSEVRRDFALFNELITLLVTRLA